MGRILVRHSPVHPRQGTVTDIHKAQRLPRGTQRQITQHLIAPGIRQLFQHRQLREVTRYGNATQPGKVLGMRQFWHHPGSRPHQLCCRHQRQGQRHILYHQALQQQVPFILWHAREDRPETQYPFQLLWGAGQQ